MVKDGSITNKEADRRRTALIDGVDIEPLAEPRHEQLPNSHTVKRHLPLCKERRDYYLTINAIEALAAPPPIVQPLHVVIKQGKKPRLVIDLKQNLNEEIEAEAFRYQSFNQAVHKSFPGCFYFKMDLSDCFLSFDVNESSRRFLAFELDGEYHQFKKLPFGLCTSPLWCERFLSIVDYELARQGLSHVRYVDDFLCITKTKQEAMQHMQILRDTLANFGLNINEAKTEGPLQEIEFLGIGLNSKTQTVFVTDKKVSDLLSSMGRLAKASSTTRRLVQSVVGKLSFSAAAIAGARPFFRSLIDATRGLRSPFSKITISDPIRTDLNMWKYILKNWNGKTKWRPAEEIIIGHDASGSGFGFELQHLPADFDSTRLPPKLQLGNGFAGTFSDEDQENATNIQWGELFAIVAAVSLYAPFIANTDVVLLTDNMTDNFVINRLRTSSPKQLRLLRILCATCAHYNIGFRGEWLKGTANKTPDFLSRPALHKQRTCASPPEVRSPISFMCVCSSNFKWPTRMEDPASFTTS
jgi:hypothetical protein